MKYILDTHTLLWWLGGPEQLSKKAYNLITDGSNTIFVSSVSTWEIIIKQSIGKLRAPQRLFVVIEQASFLELPITIAHTQALKKLPRHHSDPFDRLLVAQATVEGATIITRDRMIDEYKISTVRA